MTLRGGFTRRSTPTAMADGVHVRLMVTRGVRSTPYQDPRVVSVQRRSLSSPSTRSRTRRFTSAASSCSRFTYGAAIRRCRTRRSIRTRSSIASSHRSQATQAGADEALMLDPHGFVATCNSTHFFIVRKGEVWTSSGKYCLGGITRGLVLEVARDAGIPAFEKDFSLDRRLRRRRGVRDRHFRRNRAGAGDRRAPADWPRADGRAAAAAVRAALRTGHRGAAASVTLRIAMWSGPRNLSTAMMRSFGSRADTVVSDEPFYGCYPEGDRRPAADGEEVIAVDGLRLVERRAVDGRTCAWRSADLVPEAYGASHGRARSRMMICPACPCLPDPGPGACRR